MKTTTVDNDWLPRPAARRSLYWILPILLLAVALVAGLMYREGVWVTRDQLHFRTDSAEGLAKGMAVKLHGFAIGAVTAVELNPEADDHAAVLVKMAVERRFMGLIAKGSVISSAQEGLIGQSYLFIKPPAAAGKLAVRAVADGEQLPFERPKALSEIATDMARKVEPFVTKAGELASSLADPDGDLRQIIHQTRLATAQAPALATRADQALQRTDNLLIGVQQSVDQLNARLPAMLGNTDTTLQHAAAASGEIRQLTERHGEATLGAAEQAAQDAQDILAGARKRWPLRSLAPAEDYQRPGSGGEIAPILQPAPAGAAP